MSAEHPTETSYKLLQELARGHDFTRVCSDLGDAGVRAAWQCVQNGWISQGRITRLGRDIAAKPRTFARSPLQIIVVKDPPKESST